MAVRAVSIAHIRGAEERPLTVWNPSKASAVATQVLIEYIGVAAQFVVADAIEQTERTAATSNTTEELMLLSFLINLGSELPVSVPTERVRSAIVEKYQRG